MILERGQGGVRPGRGVRQPRATCACPSRWATTTWSRACRIAGCCRRLNRWRSGRGWKRRGRPGHTWRPVWPASSSPKRSPTAGSTRLRAAGHEVDVRLGLSPDELLDGDRRRPRADHPLGHPGHGRGARGRHRPASSSAGPASASTTSTSRPPPRRGVMVVNAPQSNIVSAAEHTMALLLAQARNVPQAHAALEGRPVGAPPVGGRRAGRQDARHRRPRPHRQAGRPAGAGLRHAARRLRPVRVGRAGPPDGRRAAAARPASWPSPTSSPSTCPRPRRRSG